MLLQLHLTMSTSWILCTSSCPLTFEGLSRLSQVEHSFATAYSKEKNGLVEQPSQSFSGHGRERSWQVLWTGEVWQWEVKDLKTLLLKKPSKYLASIADTVKKLVRSGLKMTAVLRLLSHLLFLRPWWRFWTLRIPEEGQTSFDAGDLRLLLKF